jgi:two-component system phosphate regulon response regulator OmpR
MPEAGSILVVEDDAGIRAMLVEYLGTHGYAVAEAGDGAAMRASLARGVPDVVLLDVHLPGEDGLTLARFLRERHDVGIVMVTGASDVVDRVAGLEVGADDYVTKPFDLRELRARIKSVMRRVRERPAPATARPPPAPPSAPPAPARVPLGSGSLDLGARTLFDANGAEVPLTAMEFDLLRVFVERPRQVLSRDQLLTLTRNREWEPFDRSIDIRIARLRRKIEPDPENPGVIRTVRGAGYMFVSS